MKSKKQPENDVIHPKKFTLSKGLIKKKYRKKYTLSKHIVPKLPEVEYHENFRKVTIKDEYMVFRHPLTMILAGPTGSGKTFWLQRVLEFMDIMFKDSDNNHMTFDIIHWYHGAAQDLHKEIKRRHKKIKFFEGLPTEETLQKPKSKTMLVIVDDLMSSMSNAGMMGNIFTKKSHHDNISIVFIQQNLFANSKRGGGSGQEFRDMSLNAHYLICMKNPRDTLQVKILGTQMENAKFLSAAYKNATIKPFGYLLMDYTQQAHDVMRFRTKIFPDDDENIIYVPPEDYK